jgi:glutathione S-transferase
MSLKFYFHPLASFCWKPLIALYENGTPFEPIIVDLMDEKSAASFRAVWPMGKFPVLRDEARDCTVAESTTVVEYLDGNFPGATRFVPEDPDDAWRTRMWDRLFDNYVHLPMQKIVLDRLRPEDRRDPFGVEQARTELREIYPLIERDLGTKTWMTGKAFTLADCAAAPALFYADTVQPIGAAQRNLSVYLDRLMARPSFARVLEEAEPYFRMFPLEKKPQRVRSSRPSSN